MFKWAVIGTGNIANTVCKEVVSSGRHVVTAVYSRTIERAQSFAKKFNAKCYSDLEDFFKADFDAVYIATPHSVHYKFLVECINHLKPVISEKSFTVNALQAQKVFELAASKKVFVAEAMWTRFNPVVMQVKECIKNGEIGDVVSFKANFCVPLKLSKPFMSDRVYKPEYAGGSLLDLGVYPVSYAHNLFGVPNAVTSKLVVKDGIDFDDRIEFEYSNGVKCVLYSSFNTMSYYGEVVGTKGIIKLPMFYRPVKAVLKINGEKTQVLRCKRGYIYEFDAFAEDIKEGRTEDNLISHQDSIDVMELLDEIRRQSNLVYPDKIERL